MSYKFENVSSATLVSSGSSLATAAAVAGASTFDNSATGNLCFWATFEMVVGFGSAPTANTTIELYIVPAPDGTNFADVDTSTPNLPIPQLAGIFVIDKSQTGTQRLVIERVPISPHLLNAYILNKSGQTMSSGWTLKIFPYREQ